jgi:hypothetical protein
MEHYGEAFVVNRGDFEMARVMLDAQTALYQSFAFDWTKGPPYNVVPLTGWVGLVEAKKAVKDFLGPLPEPPGAVGNRRGWR